MQNWSLKHSNYFHGIFFSTAKLYLKKKNTCNRKCCRPFLGFEATNLFAADVAFIERVIYNFPDARRGLVVEKVISVV